MLEKIDILIVGRGKLAEELLNGFDSPKISRVMRWSERSSVELCIVVHAGSGRELGDVVKFCTETGSVLLDLSTGESPLPESTKFPVVICPNVNMQMLYFMAMVKQSARYFRGQDIRITESHQGSKRTKPGTAIHLGESLGVSEDEILSERDPEVQSQVHKIPPSFLDRHAYHEIVIKNPEVEIRMETRVLGKSAYASGLAKVIDMVVRRNLAPGYYDIVDLVIDDM